MQAIEQVLSFIVEIEKLKDVHRKTKPVGLDRFENSAEHSWHVCLSALMLKEFADEPVHIDRVIKMLLIHDLGEIDAGDTIIYASETPELKAEEEQGVKRLLALLPDGQGDEYLALWREFETGDTADARYARAIDRVPPLLHNLYGEGDQYGHSWQANGVSYEQVMAVNARIGKGSGALWQTLEQKLNRARTDGVLKPSTPSAD